MSLRDLIQAQAGVAIVCLCLAQIPARTVDGENVGFVVVFSLFAVILSGSDD